MPTNINRERFDGILEKCHNLLECCNDFFIVNLIHQRQVTLNHYTKAHESHEKLFGDIVSEDLLHGAGSMKPHWQRLSFSHVVNKPFNKLTNVADIV